MLEDNYLCVYQILSVLGSASDEELAAAFNVLAREYTGNSSADLIAQIKDYILRSIGNEILLRSIQAAKKD